MLVMAATFWSFFFSPGIKACHSNAAESDSPCLEDSRIPEEGKNDDQIGAISIYLLLYSPFCGPAVRVASV